MTNAALESRLQTSTRMQLAIGAGGRPLRIPGRASSVIAIEHNPRPVLALTGTAAPKACAVLYGESAMGRIPLAAAFLDWHHTGLVPAFLVGGLPFDALTVEIATQPGSLGEGQPLASSGVRVSVTSAELEGSPTIRVSERLADRPNGWTDPEGFPPSLSAAGAHWRDLASPGIAAPAQSRVRRSVDAPDTSFAWARSLEVASDPCKLHSLLVVLRASAADRYLQIHACENAADLATSTLLLPLGEIPAGRCSTFELDGLPIPTGCVIAMSSTEATYTEPAAAEAAFVARVS